MPEDGLESEVQGTVSASSTSQRRPTELMVTPGGGWPGKYRGAWRGEQQFLILSLDPPGISCVSSGQPPKPNKPHLASSSGPGLPAACLQNPWDRLEDRLMSGATRGFSYRWELLLTSARHCLKCQV